MPQAPSPMPAGDNSRNVHQRRCHVDLQATLVFITLSPEALPEEAIAVLEEAFKRVAAETGSDVLQAQWHPGHVALHMRYRASSTLAKIVNSLKSVSSRRLGVAFPQLTVDGFWSPSYMAASCTLEDANAADRIQTYLQELSLPARAPRTLPLVLSPSRVSPLAGSKAKRTRDR